MNFVKMYWKFVLINHKCISCLSIDILHRRHMALTAGAIKESAPRLTAFWHEFVLKYETFSICDKLYLAPPKTSYPGVSILIYSYIIKYNI